jgi:hypothetical protein
MEALEVTAKHHVHVISSIGGYSEWYLQDAETLLRELPQEQGGSAGSPCIVSSKLKHWFGLSSILLRANSHDFPPGFLLALRIKAKGRQDPEIWLVS